MFKSTQVDADDAQTKPKKRGLLGGLKSVFNKESLGNAALGAGIMASAKALTGAALTLTAAPAIPALAATVATGAIVSMGLEHVKLVREDRKKREAEGEVLDTSLKGRFSEYLNVKKFGKNFSENKAQFFKKAALNATFGAAGGLAVIAADNIGGIVDTVSNWKEQLLSGTTHNVQAPEPKPVAITEPVITENPKPLVTIETETVDTEEQVGPIFNADEPFSDESVQAITDYDSLSDMPYLERFGYILDSISPKTEAVEKLYKVLDNIQPDAEGQYSSYDYARMKELAYASFNGTDGFDQIPEDVRQKVAVELYQAAAEGGNVQAQTDLAYIQYHGLVEDSISQDKDAALQKINELDKSWVGGEKLLNSYNPETAHLPKIDLSQDQQITTCEVTEKTGRILDDTEYDFSCDAPASETAKSGDYVEYRLQNFEIMGEDSIAVRAEFEGKPQDSLSFLDNTRNKFMGILSSLKSSQTQQLAMN